MGIETLVTALSLQEVYKKSTRKLQEAQIKTRRKGNVRLIISESMAGARIGIAPAINLPALF